MEVDFVFLRKLKTAANDAIGEIESLPPEERDPRWPVNWANLFCSEVGVFVNSDRMVRYVVLIEEADPGAGEFSQEIEKRLQKAGFDTRHIEIRTEW